MLLYSRTGEPAQVHCAQHARLKIVAKAIEVGTIGVNACPEQVATLRALAATSAPGFDAMLAVILKDAPPEGAGVLRRMGVYRERSTLPAGAEQHYLAMIAVGHGFAIMPTVVLLTDVDAVVAQAEVMRLCSERSNPSPLCTDPKGTLSAIAQRLLR